ncbi:MAG: hypothetical protein AAGA30_02030, partial [Planctomycetota bacterium]
MERKPCRFAARMSALMGCLLWMVLLTLGIGGISDTPLNGQQVSVPIPPEYQAVEFSADKIYSWFHGESEVVYLKDRVRIHQANFVAEGREAIVWIQPTEIPGGPKRLVVYVEGAPAQVVSSDARIHDTQWLGRLFTSSDIEVDQAVTSLDSKLPEIFQRANQRWRGEAEREIRPVSFTQSEGIADTLVDPFTGRTRQIIQEDAPTVPDLSGPEFVEPENIEPIQPPAFSQVEPATNRGGSSVDITRRDPTQSLNPKTFTNPANLNERILIASGGVRILISDPELANMGAFRSDKEKAILILADNVVAWVSTMPDGSERWELYLDGNVVFSKDRRIIYADQFYYDANFQSGTILNADILTPIQNFQGLVRLKADVVQQADENNLTAFGAAFTSSRLALPRYWLQSESIDITRNQDLEIDSSTGLLGGVESGANTTDQYVATSNRNRVYLGGLPVFAWPRFRTNLEDPSLYLKRIRIGNDNVFGFQFATTWDLKQLLGIQNRLQGVEVLGSLDYLSDRGLALGTESTYRKNSFFGYAGETRGVYRSWFINDDGLDNLGRDRNQLTPEEEFRGRILWRHFQKFSPGYNLRAELGYITDRNFLESFYEREWDTEKDATTGFWLERNIGNQSFNLTADLQLNDFFTQTSWLPRYDQYTIGQALFGRFPIVRHGHSHIGYGKMRLADAPLDPAEKFDPLAWEADVDGVRVGTRQQLEFPRQFGAVKVVPYVLGDLTYWQEDLNGDDALRAYGQTGIRASLPFWKVDPTIQSTLWNVNGLSHKVNFDVDAFYADSSQDLSRFALYDPLDDDAQEAFRRRFAFNTFGIVAGMDVPLQYDERFFALRSGFQSDVTTTANEIADDLSVIRFGVRQRWQTKRGMPGDERTIDWMRFNVSAALFPDADRDNFGSDFGMLNYDFQWFIGDRVSLVSDGYADFFSQGLRTVSLGIQSGRPGIGDAYIGIRPFNRPN